MSVPPPPREFTNTTDAWIYLKKKETEMKAQELREIFASEIQQIRNRKTNVTIIPVPAEQQETYFASLESNGVWKQVFKHLTDISDINSAYFACEMFRDHLEKKRSLMLLPQMFGLLRKHFFNNVSGLNLRLVSKAWKQAAEDNLFTPVGFSYPDWHLRKDAIVTNSMVIYSPLLYQFRSVKNVEMALEVLRHSHSAHFLLKIVNIRLNQDEDDDMSDQEKRTFFSKLVELFDIHGEHVWSLQFISYFEYEHLWNLVSRTPNLKELYLCCEPIPGYRGHLRLTGAAERRLRARLPFPIIPSLKRVTFAEIPEYDLLTKEILQKNPSVKTVSIQYLFTSDLEEFFSALGSLRLECVDFGLAEDARMDLGDIEPLKRMQWPLKVLSLYRRVEGSPVQVVSAFDFFGIMNHFNDTLEHVYLDSMLLQDDRRGRRFVVHFPNLKNVEEVPVIL